MTDSRFGSWTGIRLSLVIDKTGRPVGADGTSDSISNPEDRVEFLAQRALAEVIVTSSKTALAEGYKASKYAPIEIWTRNPDFSGAEIAQAANTKPVTVVNSADLSAAVRQLKNKAVLLETGLSLATALNFAIDEIAISVTSTDRTEVETAVSHLEQAMGLADREWLRQSKGQGVNSYVLLVRRGSPKP